MGRAEYEEEVRGWLDLQMVRGRYSSTFMRQLAEMMEQRSGHVFLIYNEIASLEGADHARPTGTKDAQPLAGVLRGLMHKHYFQPGSILKNIQNFMSSRRCEALIKKVQTRVDVPDEQKINYLLHTASISGLERRSQSRKLTGEWIVYKRHDNANYYLTLGSHANTDVILERVLACRSEFPELRLPR
ncbi:hypothetical protein [Bradyrhizobium liaoningense]|uniref:hypothetical protein n=1 Tax=Bradyrhizobium liaoningense TaxID=43992 RepID=UPI00054FAF4F|nr:hypothetical protein [Bradyrhizobium liaoningense]